MPGPARTAGQVYRILKVAHRTAHEDQMRLRSVFARRCPEDRGARSSTRVHSHGHPTELLDPEHFNLWSSDPALTGRQQLTETDAAPVVCSLLLCGRRKRVHTQVIRTGRCVCTAPKAWPLPSFDDSEAAGTGGAF